ncbi:MAG: septum site-determining protein MinD [Dehalococcoidia bacterium]|nr:septum site-determining protein MinD [Dehalococcoidia bacterium]
MKGTTIVITSGKGGVGKTTTTANLGTALAMRGHRVVVIDTDMGLRNLDVIMGMESRVVYDLVDVVEGKCKAHQAMVRDRHRFELYLIPAAQSRDKNSLHAEQLQALCGELENEFDYVIVDSPAGIDQGFRIAISPAREAIVVVNPEVAAIRDADKVIGLLEASGLRRPKLIINRVSPEMVRRGDMMGQDDIVSLLSVEVLGMVPMDERLIIAANRGVPVVYDRKSAAGAAFHKIAACMDGDEVPIAAIDGRSGLMDRVKGLIGIDRSAFSHV